MSKKKQETVDWGVEMSPLIGKYRGRRHPLKHENRYQLVAMVILSAQSTDDGINAVAPALFAAFPTLGELAKARPEVVYRYFPSVRGCIK